MMTFAGYPILQAFISSVGLPELLVISLVLALLIGIPALIVIVVILVTRRQNGPPFDPEDPQERNGR